jgi:hypothetical protein
MCEHELDRHLTACVRSHRIRTTFALTMATLLIVVLAFEVFSLLYSGTSLTTQRLRLKTKNLS